MVASDRHSEGCLQRGLTENGNSAPASKCKCRAIRDFPSGCGRLAAPIKRSSEQAIRQENIATSEKDVFPESGEKFYLDQSSWRKYYTQGEVTVVRDFPPFCGVDAPPISKEDLKKLRTFLKNKGTDLVKLLHEEKPSEKTVCTDVKHVIEAVQVQDAISLEGNAHRLATGEIQSKPVESASEKMRKQGAYEASSCNDMTEGMGNMFENNTKSPGRTSPNDFDSKSENTDNKDFETKLYDSSAFENQLLEEDRESRKVLPDRSIVPGLVAPPWLHGKVTSNPDLACDSSKRKRKRKNSFTLLSQANTRKNSPMKWAHQGLNQVDTWNKKDSRDGQNSNYSLAQGLYSNHDAMISRNKVRETLCLFQAICRKLLQEDESKPKGEKRARRVDYLALSILKDKKKCVNTGKPIIGPVPGVEIGDEFQYFVELNIIGLHRPTQGGIDRVMQGERTVATSIVASGSYEDELDNSDVLWYMGQGGNVLPTGKQKPPEDQKLERGNLALANSKFVKNPVRVIRGEIRSSGLSLGSSKTYVYDGLYFVEEFKQEPGPHGKLVYKFKLVRIPGQPEIAWKVVRKSKVRKGLCVHDISQGKEMIPICAINTRDNEKPPPFVYVPHMIYPDWCRHTPSKGCGCTNGCSQSARCPCVMKNGGEIPYNHNGSIVVPKPIVYECGPTCKCPPSCYNKVSQHGIRFQFEIFKTKSRGWGVRSLNSIPSGSFICEYTGELLEDREAEKRTWNDEYLFDIGNNYSDSSLWDDLSVLMHDSHSNSHQVVPDIGFTIDAARVGNMGRFINHSCSPNLYAQNVLYDHNNKRIPHIMLFAVENIPALQELTYHYNYKVDQVHDENGDIRKKICHCGSSKCTGRLY